MSKITSFSEMLMTKVCHDLAGALGAVNNGIEFLEMTDDPSLKEKAQELLIGSSKEAVCKLKFYRFLYGISNTDGEINFNETKQLIEEYFDISGHKIEWGENSNVYISLTSQGFKLISNLLYVSAKFMLNPGSIKIEFEKIANGKKISLVSSAPKMHDIKEVKHILADHELRDITASNVQVHYTAKIATELGALVKINSTDEYVEIECTFTD